MHQADRGRTVRCRFDGCDASIVSRVVMAAVDQLAATADADIALLDALDYPLGETLAALDPNGVNAVDVEVVDDRLQLAVHLAQPPPESELPLGDAKGVIESFFDIEYPIGRSTVSIHGSLR